MGGSNVRVELDFVVKHDESPLQTLGMFTQQMLVSEVSFQTRIIPIVLIHDLFIHAYVHNSENESGNGEVQLTPFLSHKWQE